MTEIDRAIAQIADIRAQLAMSTRFRGYAPEAVGLIAALSLLVTLMQATWPAQFAGSDRQIVVAWGLLLASGGLLVALEAVLKTLRQQDRMARAMLLGAMRVMIPGAVVAAAIPLAVFAYAPSVAWIMPGIWQMLIGFVAFASYASMPRAIVWPAAWFLLAGAAGLFAAGFLGGLRPVVAGLPFVVGHLGIAWVLARKESAVHDA